MAAHRAHQLCVGAGRARRRHGEDAADGDVQKVFRPDLRTVATSAAVPRDDNSVVAPALAVPQ